jgi:saccharopine dehydrogenase-like NADP-dependent oxidoreductase
MFPRSFSGLREASFKVAFDPEFVARLRFLVELGFASRDALAGGASPREMLLAVAARQPAPSGPPRDADHLRVSLAGRRDGRRVERQADLTVTPHERWGVAAGALDTGVPLSIAGQLLASRAIAAPGVLCPETAVPHELFFEMLERRGMRVHWS